MSRGPDEGTYFITLWQRFSIEETLYDSYYFTIFYNAKEGKNETWKDSIIRQKLNLCLIIWQKMCNFYQEVMEDKPHQNYQGQHPLGMLM